MILGMSWLRASDAWLHPATKRLVAPCEPHSGQRGYAVLTNLAPYHEDDTHLKRQARLMEHPSREHSKDSSVPPSSHDKRNATPLGLAWISKDKKSEAYNVSERVMKVLLTMLNNKSIDHHAFDSLINSNFQKVRSRDIRDSIPDCGQHFGVKRGGDVALAQLITMDSQYTSSDFDHAAWLVELDRPKRDRIGMALYSPSAGNITPSIQSGSPPRTLA